MQFKDATYILSRANTNALRGFAALGIFIFHILLPFNITPLFNLWGGLFVAIFLILSGYGINESYKKHGLADYWKKRLEKVILPSALFICGYNFLYKDGSLHNCVDELLYIKPTFWFIFHVCKCYVVYWLAMRFLKGRASLLFMLLCALVCLNTYSSAAHLEAEQSFSFLSGVLLSRNKEKVFSLSTKQINKYSFLLFVVGAIFFILKALPLFHAYIGTIPYNYFLLPFRLSWGLCFIPFLSYLYIGSLGFLKTAGKYSLEIYVAHIPFIGIIEDKSSLIRFLMLSFFALIALILYRKYIAERLSSYSFIYIIVNAVFIAKYSSRILEQYYVYITAACIVGFYLYIQYIVPFIKNKKSLHKPMFVMSIALCVAMLLVQYHIDPYSLQVDRWSALHFPIQNLLNGEYPYTAQTHLGGNASPFPVWQIFHIPFDLIGNVGLSLFFALALFLHSYYKLKGSNSLLQAMLLIVVSPAIWYEVAVRSDLITNMLLIAAIINYMLPHINMNWIKKYWLCISVMIGILACTRLIVILPFVMLFMPYYFKLDLKRQVLIALTMIVVFILTFVPFALWDWQQFYYFENNPWSLQTRQGFGVDFLIFIPLAVYLSYQHKNDVKLYYRNVGMMLFAFISITFIHRMYALEAWDLFASTFDITYLSTAIPFCIFAYSYENK